MTRTIPHIVCKLPSTVQVNTGPPDFFKSPVRFWPSEKFFADIFHRLTIRDLSAGEKFAPTNNNS